LYMSFPSPVGNAIGIFSIDPKTGFRRKPALSM
jgi:hypothetical protein